jgi:Flp pilus assembly protein TadB
MRRLVALPLVALVAAACCAAASASRPAFRLTEARASFPDRAYVLSLPTERRLDSSQVQLFEDGKRVTGLTVVPSGAGSAQQFGVVLLIDTSDSMRGQAIAGAMAAARAFANQRTGLEQLALIGFNDKSTVLLKPTSDAAAIDEALRRPPALALGTHIYDGVQAALRLIGDASIRAGSIVVLSDGADTGSNTSEASVAAAARRDHVRVFTVGLRSSQFDPSALQRLATDANGQYASATSVARLQQIYAALGAKFAREYLVSYRSAALPGDHVGVAVRVTGLPGLEVSGYVTPGVSGNGHGRSPYHKSLWNRLWTSSLTMLFIAFLVASLVALAVMALLSGHKRGTLKRRMAQFVSIPEPEQERPAAVLSDRVEEGTERVLARTRWWGRFMDELELAGITWSPRRIVLFTFIGTFVCIWLLSVITGSPLVALLGLGIPFAVRSYVRRKVARKRLLFSEQLPDNLQVLASALRAGHSFISALSVVVDDAPEPSRTEFRRVISDEQLGVSLEDALHVVVERMENRDLEQVALVAAVQRSSGGNTAEVLDRVVETIRERFELRRTVRTLTAQGRMSRWVVSALPLFLLLVISLINPGYMHALYGNGAGRVALVFAAVMVVAGSFVIKRIVNIKV